MSERAWLADLTVAQLGTWLTPPRTTAPFAILERVDKLDFPATDEAIDPVFWMQGRIFGATFELRWERRGETYRARWIGEGNPGAPFEAWEGLSVVEIVDTQSYLWGRDEVRIGRQLEYRALPKGDGRPCLRRREFRRDGVLVIDRLTEMKWEGKP